MSVHEQYDLIFRIRQHPFWGTWPICNVNHEGTSPPLQGELRFFLDSSDSKDGGIIDTIVEEIDEILNGTWKGF
ncbi:hypothetical protein, partial [Polluticaenibacter yanchengensis]|nr:hypothetical protein [Chitinophagaceae bacterium LY-5]